VPLSLQQPRDAPALDDVISQFAAKDDAAGRTQLLIKYARMLPAMPESQKTPANRVMGCTTQVCARIH